MTYDRPHADYAEAIAYLDGPSGPYAPDEWMVDRADNGTLFATFYYRPTGEGEDGLYGDALPCRPAISAAAWPHGLALSWDSVDGWTYTPLLDEWSTVEDVWEPLPVDRLASPAAIRAVLVQLLEGHEDDLPASTERWAQPQATTLANLMAAHEGQNDFVLADNDVAPGASQVSV